MTTVMAELMVDGIAGRRTCKSPSLGDSDCFRVVLFCS
jgi:hypothetical protein